MLHPIFSTVLGHPELVADHLANYASLVKEETAAAARGVVARIVAGVVAAAAAMLALGLIGVALMLGLLHGTFHWVLVLVPGAAVLMALVAAYVATRPSQLHGFADLRAQVDADIHAMHLAAGGERHDA